MVEDKDAIAVCFIRCVLESVDVYEQKGHQPLWNVQFRWYTCQRTLAFFLNCKLNSKLSIQYFSALTNFKRNKLNSQCHFYLIKEFNVCVILPIVSRLTLFVVSNCQRSLWHQLLCVVIKHQVFDMISKIVLIDLAARRSSLFLFLFRIQSQSDAQKLFLFFLLQINQY